MGLNSTISRFRSPQHPLAKATMYALRIPNSERRRSAPPLTIRALICPNTGDYDRIKLCNKINQVTDLIYQVNHCSSKISK